MMDLMMGNVVQLAVVSFGAYWLYKKFKNKKTLNTKMSKEEIESRVKRETMKMKNTFIARDLQYEKKYLLRQGFDCAGVYIFTNLRNNKKYVGQSVNILNRVETHMKGRGSKDLHADMKKGHEFIVQFIKLKDSRFWNLNSLERHYIKKMDAYHRGYNKTRGNK